MSRDMKVLERILLLLSQGAAAPSVDEGVENERCLLLSQGVAAPSVDKGIGVEILLLTQGVAAKSPDCLEMRTRLKETFCELRWC